MTMRIIAGIFAVAMASTHANESRTAGLPVGVQRLLIVDDSRPKVCRTQACPSGRQIPVLLFYPARQGGARSSTFEDLGTIDGGTPAEQLRESLIARNNDLLSWVAGKYSLGDRKTVAARINRTPSGVFLNARHAAGRFPLLLYAGGANFMVQENVALWRALAAHGYVVAAIPTVGSRSVGFSADPAGLETLSRDMETVFARVHDLAIVDDRKLGILGFSYGGAAAVLTAMRGPTASAVVGYDASFISKNYGKSLTAAPQYSSDRFTAPLLDFHAKGDDVTDEIVRSLRYSRRRSIEIPAAEHIDFTQMPEVALADFGDRQLPLRSLGTRAQAHRLLIAETVRFLDQVLKGKSQRAPYPLPKTWVESNRAELPLPPTVEELIEAARHKGYEAALRQVMRIKTNDPAAAVLSGQAMNDYGYSILSSRPRDALVAFRLNIVANPTRADLWDSLADGFIALSDKGCAAAAYRAELALLARQSNLSDLDRGVKKTAEQFLQIAPADLSCSVQMADPAQH